MTRRIALVTILAASATFAGASPASAHRSPALCTSNSLDLRIDRDRPVVFVGEAVTYTIFAANAGVPACDITGARMFLQLPTAAGTASNTLTPVTVGSIDLPSNSAERMLGRISTAITANAGVTDAVARASASGTLHDAPVDHTAEIVKTLGTTVVTPGIEVDKTADIRNGLAPQNVTYTFRVYNRTNPPMALENVVVTDDMCPNVVGPVAGDDGDRILQPAEVWEYRCTMQHGAGVFTNTATACAELILGPGRSRRPCDTDQETVEFTNPPPAAPPAVPQVAVKPTTAAQAPCTLSTPSGLRVRAGQLNTIRVRVRNVDAGSTVTLTLPGTKKKYTAKTNSSGIATLRVRPTKSGRARLSVAECSEVENLQVRPARRVTAQRNPRVTG